MANKRISRCARRFLFMMLFVFVLSLLLSFASVHEVSAAALPDINISIANSAEGDQTSSVLQILFLFIVIALLPTILLMMTSFTRIIVVLHFLRSALGTQQMPPNQVLVGIALILSIFIMSGPLDIIYNDAYVPYSAGEISTEEFGARMMEPLRDYMFNQVERDDLGLFARIAQQDINTATPLDEVPTTILVPAYILSELKKGFVAGFWLYVPFIVIDMVVASILMAMGMMMLPPAMISMPFKLMLFIMSDGWRWIIDSLVSTFRIG